MKTSCGKPVHVIPFIRTLMIVLAVAVCTVAAEDLETLRKKAEAGDAAAQNNLGVAYHNGEGVPKDYAEAMKWCRKAAEQGYASAQNNLGVRYDNGEGVPEDYAEAVKWYRKAAEQGHTNAQFDIALAYSNGRGVPADDVVAYAWYSAAAASGHGNARALKYRDRIKRKLTPHQRQKGEAMATKIYERIEKRKAAETHYE